MKHIRNFTIAGFAVFLLCSLVISAFAHSGRTDSNGGHTNHSTGEYHYHHGYSAHQHYDMDGDGIKDCPYNFKDKTGENSGSSSSGSASSYQDNREKYGLGTSQATGSTSTSGNYNAGYKAGYAKAEKDLEKEYEKEIIQTRNTAVFWTVVACMAVGFTIGKILLNKQIKKS